MPRWPVTNRFNPPTEPGIDYGTPIGTPIYAPFPGVVTITDTGTKGWGKSAQVKLKGMTYGAGHLNSFAVRQGQTVARGQLLGYTGNSGNSTGPHVELFVKNLLGQFVNPAGYSDAFFTPNPLQTGKNAYDQAASNPSAGNLPNPLDAIGQGFSDLGKNVSAAETDLVTKLISTGEIILGVLLMLGGVALLALMVGKGGEVARGAVQRFTPAGRVAGAVSSSPKASSPQAAPSAPAAQAPLSPQAQASVAAAKAGRGSKLSPEVKAELRARQAA
jgi:pyruvate/2-oxoglutarate dehydrogenase complex dihydrolipoamide acyltransferase (E2) component